MSQPVSQPVSRLPNQDEKHLLWFSIMCGSAISLFAVVWGIVINAQVIIFDGVAGLISLPFTGAALLVADYIRRPDDRDFQFGRAQLQPLVVAFQALMMLALSVYALLSALSSLLSGGRAVPAGLGVVYAVCSGLASFAVWFAIARKSRHLQSDLVRSESQQWLLAVLLTLAVLVGFLLALALEALGWTAATRYVDPVLVIVAVLAFVGVPLRLLIGSLREILLMAPEAAIQTRIEQAVREVCTAHGFERQVLRMTKTGPDLSISVGIIVAADYTPPSIAGFDQLREELLARLSDNDRAYQVWLTVLFTSDEKWV